MSRGRMLIVDDDASMRENLRRFFEGCYEVSMAATGQDAVRAIEGSERFDLLITDFDLGDDVDGLDVATAFRARNPSAPIILITGHSLTNPRIRAAREALGARVLAKPFVAEEMWGAVYPDGHPKAGQP